MEEHVNHTNYKKNITKHENYNFIPNDLKKNWLEVSKNGVNPRKACWDKKKEQLIMDGKLDKDAKLSNVARFVHPTKMHCCKWCGVEHSIYYVYPSKNCKKWLQKKFNYTVTNNTETIFNIYDKINIESKENEFEIYFKCKKITIKTKCYR